jgi:ribose transport system ATP-binding protein
MSASLGKCCTVGDDEEHFLNSGVMSMEDCLLQMRGITKAFPGVVALDHVDFTLKSGEVHVLLGENGAGKSTLIKILSGAYRKTSGDILINGRNVEINGPSDAMRLGVSVIYQELNLNPFTPVYENIFLGREFRTSRGFVDRRRALQEAGRILEFLGTDIHPATLVKNLGIAQRQMVEIAKAMAVDSHILVLDEPTATLTDSETARLFSIIRNLKAKGVGIIYISHRMGELGEIGDRCTVLRDGQYVGTVELSDTSQDELIRMMVGRAIELGEGRTSCATDEVVMEVKSLEYGGTVRNVSFGLRRGEILGISGLVGSGRTELAKCIVGEYRKTSGEIFIDGRQAAIGCPRQAVDNGIIYISEDRKGEGLVLDQSVCFNIGLPSLDRFLKRGFIDRWQERSAASELLQRTNTKVPSIHTESRNLSGGNQQKVVISRWVLRGARVYIFDEPTRGIDVAAKEEVYGIMDQLVREGASIVMISSELPEILRMSDRILVMRNGSLSKTFEHVSGLSQEDILAYEVGD